MSSVARKLENVRQEDLAPVPNLPLIQARLAKDGTDDDIKKAFTDVADKTARLKELVRLGIQAETTRVVIDNTEFIFDGDDLALTEECIVAQIGSMRQVIRR